MFSQPKRSAGRSPGGEFVCVFVCVFWWIEVFFFLRMLGARGGEEKRRHRFKPGTQALREIRKLQKSVDLLIPAAPFIRAVSPSRSCCCC